MSWPSSPGWKQWTTGPTGSPIRPEARGSSRGDSWALMVYPLQQEDRRGGPEGSWGPAAGGVPLVFKHSRQMKSSEIPRTWQSAFNDAIAFSPLWSPTRKKFNRSCLEFKGIFFGADAASLICVEEPFPFPHWGNQASLQGSACQKLQVGQLPWQPSPSSQWGDKTSHWKTALASFWLSSKPDGSKPPVTCSGGPSSVLENRQSIPQIGKNSHRNFLWMRPSEMRNDGNLPQ